jgi:hypothetical protein
MKPVFISLFIFTVAFAAACSSPEDATDRITAPGIADPSTPASTAADDARCPCAEGDGGCDCGENCDCKAGCDCGENCDCKAGCDCGENCDCGEDCDCAAEGGCNCKGHGAH